MVLHPENSLLPETETIDTPKKEGRLQALRRKKRAAEESLQTKVVVVSSNDVVRDEEKRRVRFDEGPVESTLDSTTKDNDKALDDDNDATTTPPTPSSDSFQNNNHLQVRYLQALRELGQERGLRKRSTRNMLRLAQELHRVTQKAQELERQNNNSQQPDDWQATLEELAETKRQLQVWKASERLHREGFVVAQDELCQSLLQRLADQEDQHQQDLDVHQEQIRKQQEQMEQLQQELQQAKSAIPPCETGPTELPDKDDQVASRPEKCRQTTNCCQVTQQQQSQEMQQLQEELQVKKQAIGRLQEDKLMLQAKLMTNAHAETTSDDTTKNELRLEREAKRWRGHCQRERRRVETLTKRLEALQQQLQQNQQNQQQNDQQQNQQPLQNDPPDTVKTSSSSNNSRDAIGQRRVDRGSTGEAPRRGSLLTGSLMCFRSQRRSSSKMLQV